MGNCQAIDAATLVIEQPDGKIERLYWPMSASEVMKANPGHYVALLISTTLMSASKHNNENSPNNKRDNDNNQNTNPVRLTRIKILKPTDTLVLGQVYRLITTQEVMKGLRAKKQAKMKKNLLESAQKPVCVKEKPDLEMEKAARRSEREETQENNTDQRHGSRTLVSNNGASNTAKSRTWQPSLQSISES